MSSEELSKAFYEQLGAEGLARRTSSEADAEIVATLAGLIPRGVASSTPAAPTARIALPLARLGYRIDGIDLSPEMVEAARQAAQEESLEVSFTLGSMTKLPLEDTAFDAVIYLPLVGVQRAPRRVGAAGGREGDAARPGAGRPPSDRGSATTSRPSRKSRPG